jgi:hypothetical protein
VILREPERVTLVDALRLLEGHLPAEEARSRLRQAFTQKVIQQQPLFALEYDGADIDWTTGAVKIPRKRERFYPTFSRADITNYFFENRAGQETKMAHELHTLVIDKEDVRQRVQQRIEHSKAIAPTSIRTAHDLSRAEELETKWRSYNRELLARSFTTDKYAREYDQSYILVHQRNDRYFDPSLNTLALRLLESLKSQVNRLESILERLELIDEVPHDNQPVVPAQPADDGVPDTALSEIRAVLAGIKNQLPTITASNTVMVEINADISQIEVETERPNPRRSAVKTFLESLRDNLAKAAGAGVAGSLLLLGGLLAKHFGML